MNKFIVFVLLLFTVAVIIYGCNTKNTTAGSSLNVVPYVKIEQYVGTWHEIARYPNSFQKDCVATTATYTLDKDGKIKVVNRCRLGSVDGKEKTARGKAWVVDETSNAKLKVQFFWPFSGDYWIIQLDKDYQYAVVGHPKRKYLWILSRTPEMDEKLYHEILQKLVRQGYDPQRLITAAQG